MRTFLGIMSAVSVLLLVGCVGSVDESASAKDEDEAAGDGVADGPVAEDAEELIAGWCNFQNTWPSASSTYEAQAITAINKYRATGAMCDGTLRPPVPALVLGTKLRCAARFHSKDMATHNFFDHNGSAGETPWTRLSNAGFVGAAAEGISAGYTTEPASMVAGLMSDSHCNGIMSPDYTRVGVGYVYSSTSKYRVYWTVDYGAP